VPVKGLQLSFPGQGQIRFTHGTRLCYGIPENGKLAKLGSCLSSPDHHFLEFRSKAHGTLVK
jgi:hypothetical protein